MGIPKALTSAECTTQPSLLKRTTTGLSFGIPARKARESLLA